MQITKREQNIFDNLFGIACDMVAVDNSKHAAAIVRKGIPFGMGINLNKTDPMQRRFGNKNNAFIHAEISAIKRAASKLRTKDLNGYTLVVVRSKYDKEHNHILGNSKPCSACQAAIKAFNIGKVIYSSDDGVVIEQSA